MAERSRQGLPTTIKKEVRQGHKLLYSFTMTYLYFVAGDNGGYGANAG